METSPSLRDRLAEIDAHWQMTLHNFKFSTNSKLDIEHAQGASRRISVLLSPTTALKAETTKQSR